jgi:hypothetical protein
MGAVHKHLLERIAKMERVMGCLLDHYLSDYEMNDGEKIAGMRDALCAEAERLVPNWRERRDEWRPKRSP